jgi:adenosylhomocysteine nucleosidase
VTHVLVLTAVDVEATGLGRHLGLRRVPGDFPHFRGGVLEVACVGLRAAALAERAPALGAPSLVLSAGACGALAPALATGDLVVPERVLGPGGAALATDALPAPAASGALVTVDHVLGSAADKARLWLETRALAVDMESSAIVAWARARGARAAVIRGVSDTAAEAVPADVAGIVAPGGRVRTAEALRVALARPGAVVDALALGRGTSAAVRAVAAALGALARALA